MRGFRAKFRPSALLLQSKQAESKHTILELFGMKSSYVYVSNFLLPPNPTPFYNKLLSAAILFAFCFCLAFSVFVGVSFLGPLPTARPWIHFAMQTAQWQTQALGVG